MSPTQPEATTSPLDQAALEQLFLKLEGPMYNVVYRWVWNREDAQDLVQETFVSLWRKREDLRPETLEALAYRIALNKAANLRRRRKLRRWLGMDDAAETPSTSPDAEHRLLHDEQTRAVRQAIDALPEKLRRVVVLSTFSAMSYDDIAKTLDIAPGTVASRRNAAVKRLRKTLGDDALEEPTP